MFSSRATVLFALVLAAASAVPTTDKSLPKPVTTITQDDVDDGSWFSFPLLGNLFTPLWKLFPSFTDIGSKILVDDDKFQVVINVKNYDKADLKVKIKEGLIFVQGSHERDSLSTQFFHTYTLPENATATDVTAEYTTDGVLIVSAPLNSKGGGSPNDKEIDVTIKETGTPYKKEDSTTTTAAPRPESPVVDDDDRKEPTTPSTKEETTQAAADADNSIPHGSEVTL